jgi:uncharacterized phage protein (predicted DNA packaging)
MSNIIALDELKEHLNIDRCYIEDDAYIISLLDAAVDAAEIHLRKKLRDTEYIRPSILQGVKFLVAHWYRNRENVSTISTSEIPYTFEYLMNLNRSYKNTY